MVTLYLKFIFNFFFQKIPSAKKFKVERNLGWWPTIMEKKDWNDKPYRAAGFPGSER